MPGPTSNPTGPSTPPPPPRPVTPGRPNIITFRCGPGVPIPKVVKRRPPIAYRVAVNGAIFFALAYAAMTVLALAT